MAGARRSTRRVALVVALAFAATSTLVACSGEDTSVGDGFVDEQELVSAQDEFLAFATQQLDPSSPLSVLAHAERAERDDSFEWNSDEVTAQSFARSFAKLDGYEDTADFDLLYLMNLWYGYRDQLAPEVNDAIEQRIRDFKFWYTDPTPEGYIDQRWYWSENHRLIFHAIEYLAGQAFPDDTFGTNRATGDEHRARAERFIDEWLDEKGTYGFVEWHSDVYYQKDVDALITLIEWADDDALVERASSLLDLFLFDIALHQLRGNNGVTHGRSYMKDKSNAFDQDVFGLSKLLFGTTDEPYVSPTDAGSVLLARAQRYRLPSVIKRVARSRTTYVDRERMNVPLDPAGSPDDPPPDGIAFDDPENVPFWWDRGALTAAPIVPLTLETADEYGLWATDFFTPFAGLRDATGGDPTVSADLAAQLAPMVAFGLLSEVHTTTYRSSDVMLSSALDYRPGAFGEQYHAWQATLDERAIVFTTHPKNLPQQGTEWPDSDGYWTGTGSMPRSAQDENVAIHIYAPAFASQAAGLLEHFQYLDSTHAYFPTEHFDEVVRDGNWTFGRKGDGFVALYSWRMPEWRAPLAGEFTHGLTKPFDLVAPGGAANVWIVEVGDVEHDGTFDEFQTAIRSAPVDVRPRPNEPDGLPGGFDVTYESPARGSMSFGSDGPLTVESREVAQRFDRRFDNPWAEVDWKATTITVSDDDGELVLDLVAGTRTARATDG
jgi:hypothetical protein